MKSPDVAGRRKRLVALGRSLPEASAERAGATHLAFKVRKKIFAYYLYDHHGDGRIALCAKAPPGEQARLVDTDPRRYFVPPYVGPRLDWTAVKSLLLAAYAMTAPAGLWRPAEKPNPSDRPGRRPRR
jgi:hypothetical protein